MSYYQPPEGYLYDEASGRYYSTITVSDPNGKLSRVITWFDADVGEYSREIYALVQKKIQSKVKVIIAGVSVIVAVVLIMWLVIPGRLLTEEGKMSDPKAGTAGPVDATPVPKVTITVESLPAVEDAQGSDNGSDDVKDAKPVYSEDESRQIASYLLAHQNFLHMELGEPKTDSFGVELYDYDFSCNFDEEGNVSNLSIYYLPFDLAKNDFDYDMTRSYDYGADTLDKWMEGDNTVCVRFVASGYRICLKLDYDQEILYSTIEDTEEGADPDDPLCLMNTTVPDFGTKEDMDNARDWLHENGLMGF